MKNHFKNCNAALIDFCLLSLREFAYHLSNAINCSRAHHQFLKFTRNSYAIKINQITFTFYSVRSVFCVGSTRQQPMWCVHDIFSFCIYFDLLCAVSEQITETEMSFFHWLSKQYVVVSRKIPNFVDQSIKIRVVICIEICYETVFFALHVQNLV